MFSYDIYIYIYIVVSIFCFKCSNHIEKNKQRILFCSQPSLSYFRIFRAGRGADLGLPRLKPRGIVSPVGITIWEDFSPEKLRMSPPKNSWKWPPFLGDRTRSFSGVFVVHSAAGDTCFRYVVAPSFSLHLWRNMAFRTFQFGLLKIRP